MSHLKYSAYAGHGEAYAASANMSQAVRVPVGEVITISGQGGWDRSNSAMPSDLAEEMERAHDNVNHSLIDAGGKGMVEVYKVVTYFAPLTDEAMTLCKDNMKKWFPNHMPIWTAIGIEKLALPGMHVEIEAWAHLT